MFFFCLPDSLFWQEGGVIEQLRAEGFDSLNVGDIVLANFSVTHRDSASAGRNGLLSCKAIKVQTQVSPWYSDSFSNLPNPTDDASAEVTPAPGLSAPVTEPDGTVVYRRSASSSQAATT